MERSVRVGGCPGVVGQWSEHCCCQLFTFFPSTSNKQAVFIIDEYLTGLHKMYEPQKLSTSNEIRTK